MLQVPEKTVGKRDSERDIFWKAAFGNDIHTQNYASTSITTENICSEIIPTKLLSSITSSTDSVVPSIQLPAVNKQFKIAETLTPRQYRVQLYWKSRKAFLESCSVSTIKEYQDSDPRPYAKIMIGNEIKFGLLDSGASISILGRNCDHLIKSMNVPIKKLNTFVKTADGTPNSVLGYVYLPITYKDSTKFIKFCLVPSLNLEIYLGVNFWRQILEALHRI